MRGSMPLPPEYARLADDPALGLRITRGRGATSWQVVEALKRRIS